MTARNQLPRDAVDRIEFKTPCSVPWSTMRGDRWVRHCDKCRQNVYNIEALSRDEARRLIANREGRLCVRIFRRPDGTVATDDCWSRLRAARKRGVTAWLAMLVVVGWTQLVAARFGLSMLCEVVAQATGKRLTGAWDVPSTGTAQPPTAAPWVDFPRVELPPGEYAGGI